MTSKGLQAMENPACLCSHPRDQHEDDATAPDGKGQCTACVCELFELEPDTATITEHVGTIAAALSFEALRQRLAALQIVVDVPSIEAWSLEEYDAVVAYVTAVERDQVSVRPAVLWSTHTGHLPPRPTRRRRTPTPPPAAHA